MNIVFMGTPEFALPTLEKIHNSSHSILSVVTQPDRPKGRGQKNFASPIKNFSNNNNIPVLQPENVNTPEFIKLLSKNRADYIIVVAFGQILHEDLLKVPLQFCINLHSSLLPKYRGAAPINRAILNGDSISGVTTMIMDKEMDTGDILLTQEIPIEKSEDANSLHDKLSESGGELTVEEVKQLQEIESEQSRKEDEQAMKDLNQMYDPETGMFSGMFKTIEKLPVNQLRIGGFLFALIGFVIVWYFKR